MLTRIKQLTLSLCFIGFSAGTWAQTILVKSQQNIEEYQLDNGLRVVFAPNDKESKIFINTIYLTGSLNDPQGKGGLAHLLEHLAFKGTQHVQGEEFQRRLDQYTLMTNASTDYYSTRYTNIVRPDINALDQVLYLEAERMDQLVLQQKFVPSEIEIVKREREIRLDQPFAVLMDQMWKAAYGNQYLGRLPIGDLNELKSIQMDELNQFYRTWYAPNNAVMVVTGKFKTAEVLKRIEQKFSAIPARTVPESIKVPQLESSTLKQRNFMVKKGSDLAKFHIYMAGKNSRIQPALALAPYLYTLQPSGHLYQSLVESGISTNVQSTTWLDQDFNLVFMGAIYAPSHDEKNVEHALAAGVEQTRPFNTTELQRVKNLMQNQADSILNNAVAIGSRLSDYVVSSQGNWDQYFKDLKAVQALNTEEVNQTLQKFLTPQHRIFGDIQPTPEEQKKALAQQQATEQPKTLDQLSGQAEPLYDAQVYKQQVTHYLTTSKQLLDRAEKKVQRGTLKNGMRYALFPTSTRDDKTYATISLQFGDEKSLFNRAETLDLMAYLLLRGTEQYSLQDIADKSIAAGGRAMASADDNGLVIQIQAKKDKFDEFFKFVVELIKHPTFEQTQFDLIRAQSLASLDRPYTEPATVAALTMARLIEIYPPGDLRYHFEPELAKTQLQAAKVEQVRQLYRQFIAMDHAQVAITGEFKPKPVLALLQREFGQWKGSQPYHRLDSTHVNYKAQQVHALSEQREFGNYQGLLTFPVGVEHSAAPALIAFSHILGNSQLSSRLARELREKNALVYGFGSSLQLDPYTDVGGLAIEANYTTGRSAQVSRSVHQVLNELLQHGVTEQELEAAKADILKQRVTALEDDRNIHAMLNSQLERGKKMQSRAQRDMAIARLTKADVDAAIRKYIHPEQLVEVMADQYGQSAP